jgi:acylpyruvate hydrolase
MKLVTADTGVGGLAGVLLSDGSILCVDPSAEVMGHPNAGQLKSVRTILTLGLLPVIQDLVARVESDPMLIERLKAADTILPASSPLMAPIPDPSFILAQGLAYRKHLEEMNVPLPKEPASLIKLPSSLTGSGRPILLPSGHPNKVDYEGEFCAVIGKECYRVQPSEVYDYIAGYTIMNDVSARDWVEAALEPGQAQMQAVLSWNKNLQGKQFPTFTPVGPCMLTADEVADPHELELTTTLNGEVMQHTAISDLIFRVEEFIAHYSQWYKFLPGDIISTGTPEGVGQGRDPKVYLKPGDVIEVSVTSIGTLSNVVVAE